MTDNIYSISEIVGSSHDSSDDAIRNAIARAHKTIRNLAWFTVTEIRGYVTNEGEVGHFQVTLKVGFRLEDRQA
jgi:dodecin